jgi:hypothetical protein
MLWHEFRASNANGSGLVQLENALPELTGSAGYSRSAVYRLLKAGQGVFWHFHRGRIELIGLLSVAAALDAELGERRNTALKLRNKGAITNAEYQWRVKTFTLTSLSCPVQAPAVQGRQAKLALLYSSIFRFAGAMNHPICRQSIQLLTGCSKRTQKRFQKLAGIHSVWHPVSVEGPDGRMQPLFTEVAGKSTLYVKQQRAGNSYSTPLERGRLGMVPKVGKQLQQAHRSCVTGEASGVTKRSSFCRRFFFGKNPGNTIAGTPLRRRWPGGVYYPIPVAQRLRPGRAELCLVEDPG